MRNPSYLARASPIQDRSIGDDSGVPQITLQDHNAEEMFLGYREDVDWEEEFHASRRVCDFDNWARNHWTTDSFLLWNMAQGLGRQYLD